MKTQTKMNVYDVTLDPYEQEIEDNFEKMEKYPQHIRDKKMKEAKEAATHYFQEKEKQEKIDLNLHIHIYNKDLQNLQAMATQQKLSLGRFITGILHQYSSEHFI